MHPTQAEDNRDPATVTWFRASGTDDSTRHASQSIHSLLERTAEECSDKTALICGDTTLTYGQLNSLANNFARALVRRGIGKGDLVGVALDRSVDLVAALLAVWKTGAAYVPIDPDLPGQRIDQMLDDASPKLLVTSTKMLDAFTPGGGVSYLTIEEVLRTTAVNPDSFGGTSNSNSNSTINSNPDAAVHSTDLAYVISADRLLAITTVSFDMAVPELFLPLLCGATTVLAQRRDVRDPAALVRLIARHTVTVMQGTPTLWQMLLDSGWPGGGQPRLSKILCGGEALPRALADRLLLACGSGGDVWNLYGPTEVTVYASIWRVQPGEAGVLIGSPVANGHLYVLDPETLAPVPLGSEGELCVGGAGVARGYRGNAELSRARFVENPFDGGVMYRTGDLARFVAPGKLNVLGRMDGQVKIRGYRIEVGDIEAAITAREDISAAVVVCRDDQLVAYCVPKATVSAGKTEEALDQVLRPWLAERLPDYMVPAFVVEIEALPQAHVDDDAADQDIAIVSMACRLPGGIATPEDLWQLLERGGDAIGDVPDDRWNRSNTIDDASCHRGGFLQPSSINSFDISFFGISPREARRLDPAQYLMLETCWEGFERAGYTMEQLRGSQTGVFVGTSNILAHQALNAAAARDLADLDGYTVTGSAGGSMSGRISHQLGLQGPAMTIDTACSSSLVTTHLACSALRQGECDMAVSAGVSLLLNPGLHVEFSRLRGMLGDPIEATALAEVFGPGRVSRKEPLLIGSAKSNIGHTQAAAGVVGLLKVVLAIRHGMLPETLHVAKPTPAVDWQGANMTPVLSKRLWRSTREGGRVRRAGVSSFGIGGTNAHVIVEEPPRVVRLVGNEDTAVRLLPAMLPFLISGDTSAALRMQAQKLGQHLWGSPDDGLGDVAYSLATTRNHLRRRLVLMARDKAELLEKLGSALPASSISDAAKAPDNRLAMLFSGQGSQWPGMGKDLSEVHPVFGEAAREIAAEFDGAGLELPLLDVMWANPESTEAALLDRTDFAQPALFTLEVALWRLWQSWGVKPDFVLGHSLGELVAAHVAGILDLPDACRLVAARGRLMQAQSGDYGMVSLGASAAEIAKAVKALGRTAEVDIAAYNTPMQTVISGTTDGLESITGHFAAQGRKTKLLMVGHAFHSRHIDAMLSDFLAVAETVQFHAPKIRVIRSLDGRLAKPGQLEQAQYWLRQAREPVRFTDGIQTLARQGVNVFLEIGPHPVLCGMGAACLADHHSDSSSPVSWLPSLLRRKDGAAVLQRSLSHLHMRHLPLDWQAYFKPFGCRRVQLPTYAFQRTYEQPHAGRAPGMNGTSTGLSHTAHRVPNGGGNDRFQFDIAWQPTQTDGTHQPSGTWALLVPARNSTWTTSVTTALSGAGFRLVQVDDLEQAAKLDGLVCLWDTDTDVISQTRDLSAKALAQLQTAAQTRFTPPLVWVTRHAVGVGIESDDRAMRPGAGSLLWGLMRTARSEHPELSLRLVDLGQETTDASFSSALLLNTEPECAVRRNRVLVPRMQRVDAVTAPLPGAKDRLVRPDGAVLITGGLGNLGACVARWLASEHGIRDLVLTSRQGVEAPGADALVAELSELGARVTVMAGNIADPASIDSILATFNKDRPLRGVVHAAGVVDSGVLSTMTLAQCETTIAPKAYGAWLLHQATRGMDLDLFVMFSSVSGVMGMPGLANYAAANTYLDALAHLRHAQGLPATSVAYGTWAGDGMASRLGPATNAHLVSFGLDPLAPSDGLDLLTQAAVSKRALTVAASLDTARLGPFYEEQGGGIPPLLRSLLQRDGVTTTKAPSGSFQQKHLRDVLREAEPPRHAGILLDMVRQVVAKALGFSHPLDVEVDRPLKDVGIDSCVCWGVAKHGGGPQRVSRCYLWEDRFASLVRPIVGDMSQPLFGLSDAAFSDLGDQVDSICHAGGLVDWMRPLDEYVGPNIVSAHEVLRLAARGRRRRAKAVHLVSTVSTLPKHMGLDVGEGDVEYGYATSKYVAERLLAAARWRGARASVYRLPYVTASAATGHFRHDRGDFLHSLVVGGLEIGAFPALDADLSAVLPVDYLAKTIVAVMTGDLDRLGRDWDFLNPRAPTSTDFFKLIGAVSGGEPKEIIDFGIWRQRALDYAAEHPTSPLARITAVLDGFTDETAGGIMKSASMVGEHVFGGDAYPVPLIDEQFVRGYCERINTDVDFVLKLLFDVAVPPARDQDFQGEIKLNEVREDVD
ncbi:hypothetical protein C8A01DRAFT_48655 [Parachaetomium inaequale]|uniref:Ketosynthase family 3 (KS3) domain-containing protein n=1 Tax=Parachaetomium inaequale TaxID=2588326 RepID=A0AAN6PB58_9PEZI|nr:hypothetical protein C8A01DRAFT_48655 [Parachaetomium inaequale]